MLARKISELRDSAMADNFAEESQNADSVNPRCESVKIVGLIEVPDPRKEETCLNSETNLLNQTYHMMEKVDNRAPCNLNIDIEKGMAEIPNSSEESSGCLKSDDCLARALQKVVWLQLTGIFMYLFMHQSLELPKVASKERIYDAATNRSRKYKRSPSFNSSFSSRRVVLLFSVMSSMGTIVLIYLTLRVRQISDGSGTM